MSTNTEIEQLSTDVEQLAEILKRARLVSSLRELFESTTADILAESEEALIARYQYSEDEIQVLPYKKSSPETLTLNENGQILQEVPIVKAENERLKGEIEKTLGTVLDRVNQQDDANQMNQLNSLLLEFQKKLKIFKAELPAEITLLESIE